MGCVIQRFQHGKKPAVFFATTAPKAYRNRARPVRPKLRPTLGCAFACSSDGGCRPRPCWLASASPAHFPCHGLRLSKSIRVASVKRAVDEMPETGCLIDQATPARQRQFSACRPIVHGFIDFGPRSMGSPFQKYSKSERVFVQRRRASVRDGLVTMAWRNSCPTIWWSSLAFDVAQRDDAPKTEQVRLQPASPIPLSSWQDRPSASFGFRDPARRFIAARGKPVRRRNSRGSRGIITRVHGQGRIGRFPLPVEVLMKSAPAIMQISDRTRDVPQDCPKLSVARIAFCDGRHRMRRGRQRSSSLKRLPVGPDRGHGGVNNESISGGSLRRPLHLDLAQRSSKGDSPGGKTVDTQQSGCRCLQVLLLRGDHLVVDHQTGAHG